MEKIVSELKKVVSFKNTVDVGDIVLIAAKKPQMLVYGFISEMVRDETRRDEWYHVGMHLLTLPPSKVTWTLRPEQMSGQEIFTMDGEERFMKAVAFDSDKTPESGSRKQKKKDKTPLKRIK
jgi:hypothetical protein